MAQSDPEMCEDSHRSRAGAQPEAISRRLTGKGELAVAQPLSRPCRRTSREHGRHVGDSREV